MKILVPSGPWFSCIKVSISPDAVTREIRMRQEASFAIKWAAVTVETLREEEHDVGKVLHLVPYVTVGDFPETERGDALPHLEGPPDGLMGFVLAHLWGVVLYSEQCVITEGTMSLLLLLYESTQWIFISFLTYEKVMSLLSHFKPWMAYRFLLRLLFSSAPNLSGTPQRGRFIALSDTKHSLLITG